MTHQYTELKLEELEKRIEVLEQLLPSAEKTGHWIDREIYDADRWKCSECGRTEQWKENFCPNCGARMESEVTDADSD